MSSARRYLFHVFFASAVIASLFGCRKSSQTASPAAKDSFNVLIITLDTTRADHLGCYGYGQARTPNLDRMAREGVRFAHAYSPVPLTLPAHCSIFTGKYPLSHRVRNNGNYFLPPESQTLAEILQGNGYAAAAFVASFILDSRFGLDQGFDVYEDEMGDSGRIKTLASELQAAEVADRFSKWFATRPEKPFLAWVHFFDPHLPYDPPEHFKSEHSLSPYDGEIANVDHAIGRIIGLLEAQNLLDRTLIVAAGDHGEGFGEHGESGHGVFGYGEAVDIPLILRAPGKLPAGSVSSAPVSLVDILPTVLDFLKLPVPADVQGIPLQRQLKKKARSDRPLFIETVFLYESLGCSPLKGVIQQGFKYVELPRPELYDLGSDPQEKTNLFSAGSKTARALRLTLEVFEKKAGASSSPPERRMSAEERARLESLGYLAAQHSASSPGAGLSDPKDAIRAWTLYQSGEQLFQSEEEAGAEEKFRAAIEENPRIINAYGGLADIYFRRNDVDALDKILVRGISANPRNGTLRLRQLFYFFQLGRIKAVLQGLADAEAIIPYWQQEQFNNLAGNAFGRAGQYRQAAAYFAKILAIEPSNASASKNLGYALFMDGRNDEALKHQREAEKGLPEDPQLAAETAATLARLNESAAAGRYFEKALQLRPSEEVALQYAEWLAGQKEYARAAALLRTYMQRPESALSFRTKARRLISLWQRRD